MIMTIIYAPPGTAGQGARSSVDYGASTTFDTETSVTHAFKNDLTITASASANAFGASVAVDASFGMTTTKTNSSSLDVKTTTGTDIKVTGPNKDGIDHDLDVIYLWLNPQVAVEPHGPGVSWSLQSTGAVMDVQYVYVGWLKDPSKIPRGVLDKLNAANITPADYQTILSRDAFAHGGTALDPHRFWPTSQTFPYEPPYAQGDTPPVYTY
jgi:hypothetical protein